MAEKDAVILRRMWRKLYKPILDEFFRDFQSSDILLMPDVAMEELEGMLARLLEGWNGAEAKKGPTARPTPLFRFDAIAFRREAHHYAVDLFYKTYHLTPDGREGETASHLKNEVFRRTDTTSSNMKTTFYRYDPTFAPGWNPPSTRHPLPADEQCDRPRH